MSVYSGKPAHPAAEVPLWPMLDPDATDMLCSVDYRTLVLCKVWRDPQFVWQEEVQEQSVCIPEISSISHSEPCTTDTRFELSRELQEGRKDVEP